MMVIDPATNWPQVGVPNCTAHRCAAILHRRRNGPSLGVAQRRFRALVDVGKGPPATRLSTGRLLFLDDALAAWLAERRMRMVR
jgi:hypothetical protein